MAGVRCSEAICWYGTRTERVRVRVALDLVSSSALTLLPTRPASQFAGRNIIIHSANAQSSEIRARDNDSECGSRAADATAAHSFELDEESTGSEGPRSTFPGHVIDQADGEHPMASGAEPADKGAAGVEGIA